MRNNLCLILNQDYDPQESVVEPIPVEQPDVQNLVDIQEELL